jgi:hypothetical protein
MNISSHLPTAVMLYRILHKESRAVDHTTWAGSSGVVRRATCIYCRRVVATSSAKYPETQKSFSDRLSHGESCAQAWLEKHVPLPDRALGILELALEQIPVTYRRGVKLRNIPRELVDSLRASLLNK